MQLQLMYPQKYQQTNKHKSKYIHYLLDVQRGNGLKYTGQPTTSGISLQMNRDLMAAVVGMETSTVIYYHNTPVLVLIGNMAL